MTPVGVIFFSVFLGMAVGAGVAVYEADDEGFPWGSVALGKIIGGVLGGALAIALLVIWDVYLSMW
ncbi:MAG: hypothetical protein K2Z80_04605 [Xanthobacteraceae bacterium]|nr:hypothetical protein [Xanthobacteraceae bacterium]